MNLPNKLTLLRVFMIPVFLILTYLDFAAAHYLAMGVFILASATDFVDGYIARRDNLVTDFGKFMDPLADKALVVAAMLRFVEAGIMPAWAAFIVVLREFAVTGLRLVAVSGDSTRVIAAAKSGKVKTVCTMICLIAMFLALPPLANGVAVGLITITTLYSGVEYFVNNRDLLNMSR